jgi:hypothetical protein
MAGRCVASVSEDRPSVERDAVPSAIFLIAPPSRPPCRGDHGMIPMP